MSFDKVKAMRNAEHFLAQGKLRAAISEYKRVIEADKKDYNTLNMLGDLYAKASEPDEAINCFTQVAEHYGKQGFAQKAIAIYNKISRLKPDSLEVSAKLAQLYQMKGSVAEARTHYTTLAEQYTRTGKKAEALNVWKQIANLDPNNTDIYLKIADACWQDQQKEEAANAYIEAGNRLTTKNQFESAITAFSRALEIRPDDLPALRGYVTSQIGLGYADEAAKSLESSLVRQPHSREIINLLADCYIEAGKLADAEQTIVKLVEKEPTHYPKLLEIFQAYLKAKDTESATRMLAMASEHLLVGGRAIELAQKIDEILDLNPDDLDGIRLLVRFNNWQRDENGIKDSMERLAEAARANNAVEDERYALSQLVLLAPQNIYFAQRLQELNLANGYTDGYYENPQLANGSSNDVPTFESFTVLGQEDEAVFAEYKGDLEYVHDNGNGHSGANEAVGEENQAVETVEETNDDSISENDLESIETTAEEPAKDLSEYEKHSLQREIEGIDFYLEQGFYDLAEKTVDELAERYGSRPELDDLRESIKSKMPQSAHEEVAETKETEEVVEPQELVETPELVETEELVETQPFVESQEVVETEESVQSDYTEEFESEVEEQFAQPIVENNEEEVSEPTLNVENTEAQSNDEVEEVESVSVNSQANSFDEMKSEISAVENENNNDDDFETSYQTGIVYREMGLIEDSIREFQDAIKLVTPQDGTRRFFLCCNMLGHCFMEKEMPTIAIMWFKQGLDSNHLSQYELNGMRYELANAYEKGGDKQKAKQHFEEIYGVDVDFRDVGAKLQNLALA